MVNVKGRPKLIVFDLDYTLWPFWVDTHVTPPFRSKRDGGVMDSFSTVVKCYPEVPAVLKSLQEESYVLGVASRTSEIQGARQLIELFGWSNYFTYNEIYPGCKVTHFNNFKKQSGIDFKDMIFFDDERRNIRDLTRHGVLSIEVPEGITWNLVQSGLEQFSNQL